MYDPEHFPEPHKFKPERFINKENQFESDPRVMPFSIGKRQCPGKSHKFKILFNLYILGEGLAKMELFLFIANLLNQYKVSFSMILKLTNYF